MPDFAWLPANRAATEDVEAVLATGGAATCRCQALKVAGSVAIEPRDRYSRLWSRKQAWMRTDPDLEGVWSVTCFVVRKGLRQSGLTYELAAATVEYGEQVGARVRE